MITLAIDTSHLVAVGLDIDGEHSSLIIEDERAHVEELTPTINALCNERGIALRDVDRFVVGMGPGPFTGLRVGIATAATLAHIGGKPLHRVCSLDALALTVDTHDHFVAASDARRKELYWALYVGGKRVGEPRVTAPTELPDVHVFGPVPESYRELLQFAGERTIDPGLLANRFNELEIASDEPYYLRGADATVPGAPKSALPRLQVRR